MPWPMRPQPTTPTFLISAIGAAPYSVPVGSRAMAEDRVRIEVSDHVALVTLTRPDKHNALDRAMFEGIVAAAEEVGATPGVRAVVLCGDGPSFYSGLAIASFLESEGNGTNGGGLE